MTEPPRPNRERVQELAALHALGLLTPADEAELRAATAADPRLAAESAAFERTAGAMAAAVAEVPPAEGARERFLATARAARPGEAAPAAQPWKRWDASAAQALRTVVRASEEGFQSTTHPGVAVRQLFVDAEADRVTMLIRMDAGSSYPRHRHASPEECFVLRGDLRIGETVLHAGDYERSGGDSVHDVQWTKDGCLLFIVSSQHDELLPA